MTTNEAAALLAAHDGIELVTHTHPDGDTLCSAAALCSMLRRMGKRAWLFPNGEITEKFQPLTAAFVRNPDATLSLSDDSLQAVLAAFDAQAAPTQSS